LYCDGELVGTAEIPRVTPRSFNTTDTGLSCGYELGPAVGDDYEAPFRCNGALRRVVVEVDLTGEDRPDPRAEFEAAMAQQ
jgi:hypothetical protein